MVFGDVEGLGDGTGDRVGALILASARGDRDAFAALYDLIAPRAFGVDVQITPDRTQAESALRDAFVEVARTAGDFDPGAMSGRAWVLGIVHRHAVGRRGERSGSAAMLQPTAPPIAGRRMARALSALSEDQRTALTGAYFAGHSEAELAVATGATVEMVRARLRDGLSRVRSELGIVS